MDRKRYNSLLWCACLLLAGCAQGEAPDATAESMAVTLQAVQSEQAPTRAATALTSGAMGVYRTTDNGYAALANVRYTYDSGQSKWVSDNPADKTKTVYVDHRDATLYAYYPYWASAPANGVFTLALKRFTQADALCYADRKTGVNNRNASIVMNMKPAYTRLTLRIRNSSSSVIVPISVKLTSVSGAWVSSATLDMAAEVPAIVNGATGGEYIFPFVESGAGADAIVTAGIAAGAADETVSMLWIPQTLPGDLAVRVRYALSSGEVMDGVVTIGAGKLSQLKQGYHYVLPLLVRASGKLEFTDVEMKDWTAVTVPDTEMKEDGILVE